MRIIIFFLLISFDGMAQKIIDGLDIDAYFFTISKKSINILLEIQNDNPDTIIHYLNIVRKELADTDNRNYNDSIYYSYTNHAYFERLDGMPLLVNCKEVADEYKFNNLKLVDECIKEINNGKILSLEQKGDIYRLIFGYYNQKTFRNQWYNQYYIRYRDSVIRKLGKIIPNFKKQRNDKSDNIFLKTFEYEEKFHFLFEEGYQHLFQIEPNHIQKIKKALNNKKMFNKNYELDVKVLQKMIEIAEVEGDYIFFTITY